MGDNMTTVANSHIIELMAEENQQLKKTRFIIPNNLSVEHDLDYELPSEHGMMRVMSWQHGDARVVWNKMSIQEIESARKMFIDLCSKGHIPHWVDTRGKMTPEIMAEFDPAATEVIFQPPIQMIAGG
jgi:hypothetical protein